MNPRVTLAHLRQLRFCMSGVRAWCERMGFSFDTLRTEGLDAGELEATGDAFALKAAEVARAEYAEAMADALAIAEAEGMEAPSGQQ